VISHVVKCEELLFCAAEKRAVEPSSQQNVPLMIHRVLNFSRYSLFEFFILLFVTEEFFHTAVQQRWDSAIHSRELRADLNKIPTRAGNRRAFLKQYPNFPPPFP
jgi:hypothetical protein